jgi:hypothetical protein
MHVTNPGRLATNSIRGDEGNSRTDSHQRWNQLLDAEIHLVLADQLSAIGLRERLADARAKSLMSSIIRSAASLC